MALEDLILPLAISGVAAALAGLAAWQFYARFYVTVPPNRALVLFGNHRRSRDPRPAPGAVSDLRKPRTIVGGSVYVAPWHRGFSYLPLDLLDVDCTVRTGGLGGGSTLPAWEVRLGVRAKIPAEAEILRTAAENLLGKTEEELRLIVCHTVEASVPAILARLGTGPDNPDWERLAAEIQAAAAPDLVAVGLVVRSLAVKDLRRIPPSDPESTGHLQLSSSSLELPPAVGDLGLRLRGLGLRIEQVERSLGIMGAEIVRMARDAPMPILESAAPEIYAGESSAGSSARPPDPGFDLSSESGAVLPYDSIGGDPAPRSRRRTASSPREDAGPGATRSLLNVER